MRCALQTMATWALLANGILAGDEGANAKDRSLPTQLTLVQIDDLGATPFQPLIAEAKSEDLKTPDVSEVAQRRTQWLVFQTDWCGPCRAAKADFIPWLQASSWKVDESEQAHVRLVNGDRNPAMTQSYRVGSYPTFILLQDGREVQRFSSYPGRQSLVSIYVAAVERAKAEKLARSEPADAAAAITR